MAVAMDWGWLSSTTTNNNNSNNNNNNNNNKSNNNKKIIISSFPSKNSSTSASSSSPTQQHLLSNPSSVKQWDWDGPSSSSPTMAIVQKPSSSSSSSATIAPPLLDTVDLQASMPVPWGWERCLDLKSGQVYLARSGKDKLEMEEEGKLRKISNNTNADTHSLVGSESSKLWLEKSKLTIDWLQGKPPPSYNNVARVGGGGAREDEEAVVGGGAPHGKDFRAPVELKLFDDVSVDLELNLRTATTTAATTTASTAVATTRASKSLHEHDNGNNNINGNDNSDSLKLPISFTELLLQSSKDRPLLAERPNWVESLGIGKKPIPAPKSPPQHVLPRPSRDDTSSAMATAACSKCLMYVLLWRNNPSCPKCGSPVFLDYPNPNSNPNNNNHPPASNQQEEEPEEGPQSLPPFKRGRHHGPNNNGTFFTIEDCSLALSNHHETNQPSKPTSATAASAQPYYKLWQT